MYAYLRTYLMAANLTRTRTRDFSIDDSTRRKYIVKAANLAICFLGFSAATGKSTLRKSAELGCLAALFDLVSDKLNYSPPAIEAFRATVADTVPQEFQSSIISVLERKQRKQFTMDLSLIHI